MPGSEISTHCSTTWTKRWLQRDLMRFVGLVTEAKSEADLELAGTLFASIVMGIGSTVVSALFFKARPKIYRGPPTVLPPAPRGGGRFFYRPVTTVAPLRPSPGSPPGTMIFGITDEFGNITINTRLLGQPQSYLHTLLHEKVHQFLSPPRRHYVRPRLS